MRKVFLGPLAQLLSWALLVGAPAWAAEDAHGEQLLPPQTHLLISVPSVPDLVERFHETAFGQLLADEAVQPFLKQFTSKLDEASDKIEEELGVSLEDLKALPEGEVTFAVVEKPARKLALVLMIDCGENQETIDKLLDKMNGALADAGAKESMQEVGDIEVQVFSLPKNGQSPFQTLAYFQDEGYLVLGTEVEALKSIIERWNGESSSTLATQEAFKYIQEKCATDDEEPLLKWYINPVGLLQAGIALVQGQAPQAGLVMGMLPILGLDHLKGIGGGFDAATEQYDSVYKVFLYVEQPTSGVLSALHFPAIEQSPPKWVPADVASYAGMNWAADEAYAAIESIVDSFQGPGAFAKAIDMISEQEDGPQVHVKKDVVDQLSGRVHVLSQAPSTRDDAPPTPGMYLALGLKDAAAVKKTLAKAAKTDGFKGQTRTFKGETIYEMSDEQPVSVAVVGDNLVVTTTTALLERALSGDTKGALVDSADYKALAKLLPKKLSMLGFQQQDAQLKAAYDLLTRADSDALGGVDLKSLPSFETLRKYLRPAISYAIPDERGALMVGFSLKAK